MSITINSSNHDSCTTKNKNKKKNKNKAKSIKWDQLDDTSHFEKNKKTPHTFDDQN